MMLVNEQDNVKHVLEQANNLGLFPIDYFVVGVGGAGRIVLARSPF